MFFDHTKKLGQKYRAGGFAVQNYIVLRSYRGNLFNIEDMQSLPDTNPFWGQFGTNFDQLINMENEMKEKEEKSGKEELPETDENMMFFNPPVFDIISIGLFKTKFE